MVKKLICFLLLAGLVTAAYGAITTPTDTVPTAARGWMYYDLSEDGVKVYNNSDWILLGTSGSAVSDNTLDMSYDEGGAGAGAKINADSGTVEIEVADGSDNTALLLDCDDSTNDPTALLITNAADAANAISIDIDAQTTGRDIEGSGATWYVTGSGAITASGLTLGPAAASTITVAADGAGDDLTLSVTGAQDASLKLASAGTGADAMSLTTSAGGLDITVGGTAAAGEDLDITSVSSININSSEAGVEDAVVIEASGAGSGIDITSLHDIDITTTGAAGEDISLINTGGSINLSASEADAAAITITASANGGGIDIAAQNDIDIVMTNGAAGEDIQLNNTGGSVNIIASEADAAAIALNASDAAGGITVDYGTGNMVVTGTGASADFTLDADLISIDGTGTSNITFTNDANEDVTISTAGAADHSLILQATGTAGDALQIITTAGGIDITNGGAAGGEDIDIDAVLASFNVNADEDVADAVTIAASTGGIDITADGAAGKDLDLVCTNGSTNISGGEAIANAVTIAAGAGGVDISSAATFDIDITATGGKILANATEDAAGAISLIVNGGTSETIVLTNTQGTGEDAFDIDATAGGIDIDAAAAKNINIAGGQIALVSKDDAASAISLTANVGTSETIVVTNTKGTDAAAIALTATAGGITLNTATAGITCSGDVLKGYSKSVTDDTDNALLTSAQSGGVFTNNGDTNNQIYTLPTAATGLFYTFADVEVAAGADLYIKASAADTIAGGAAAAYYACKTDAVSQSVTIVAVNDTEWVVVAEVGTWVADDAPD